MSTRSAGISSDTDRISQISRSSSVCAMASSVQDMQGKPLIGFPLRVQLSACRRPLLQRKSAHQKGAARRGGHFVGILRSWQGARNPRIPQGRECVQGKPWSGFPCAFGYPPAGDRFCSAKARTKKERPAGADIFGAGMGTRTPTREHENLNLACLPIPSCPQIYPPL